MKFVIALCLLCIVSVVKSAPAIESGNSLSKSGVSKFFGTNKLNDSKSDNPAVESSKKVSQPDVSPPSVSKSDICNLPKPDLEGNCRKSKFGYYYNVKMQDCKTFFLIGCDETPGTSPGFGTKKECMKTCMNK